MADAPVAWAISSGSYSDYRVHAIFATEELANAVKDLGNEKGIYDGFDVETIPYFTELPEYYDQSEVRTEWKAGATAPTAKTWGGHIRRFWPWSYQWDEIEPIPKGRARVSIDPTFSGGLVVSAKALDKETASKAMSDTNAQIAVLIDSGATLAQVLEAMKGT